MGLNDMKSFWHGEKPALAPVSTMSYTESVLYLKILLGAEASKAQKFASILVFTNFICNECAVLSWAMDNTFVLCSICLLCGYIVLIDGS